MRTTILVLALLMHSVPTLAQVPADPAAVPASRVIVVQLRAELDSSRAPERLFDQLTALPALLELSLAGTDGCQRITMRFAFATLADYQAWRERVEREPLFRELHRVGGRFETTLSMQRMDTLAQLVGR